MWSWLFVMSWKPGMFEHICQLPKFNRRILTHHLLVVTLSSSSTMVVSSLPPRRKELLHWDFYRTVKAFVNVQQQLQENKSKSNHNRIRRNFYTTTTTDTDTNSEMTSMVLIELNHWSMEERRPPSQNCNDDDYSVFLIHPPVLLPLSTPSSSSNDAQKRRSLYLNEFYRLTWL